MSTTKKKKEPVTPFNVWFEDGVEYEHADFMKRLKEVHGIDTKTMKGTREMIMHMDGDTWFDWQYRWKIAGKEFVQHTRTMRTGMNREIWAGGEE